MEEVCLFLVPTSSANMLVHGSMLVRGSMLLHGSMLVRGSMLVHESMLVCGSMLVHAWEHACT